MKYSKLIFSVLILSASYLTAQTDTLKSPEYMLGLGALKNKDTSKAIDFFKESAKYNKDAASYFKVAELMSAKKTHTVLTTALQYLGKAIELEPRNVLYKLLDAKNREALFHLSRINIEERQAAIKQYKSILEIDSNNVEANSNLGRLKKEDFLQFNRSTVKSEVSRSLSTIEKNDIRRSQAGTNDIINNNLNAFLEKNKIPTTLKLDNTMYGMFAESEKYLLKAIQSNPNSANNYFQLTLLYIDCEVPSKAIAPLNNLKKIVPKNKDTFIYLGLVYHLLHDDEKSAHEYNDAFSLMSKEEFEDYKLNTVKLLLAPKYGDQINSMDESQLNNLIYSFWLINDPLILTPYNERLIEHYSRVAYANLFFTVSSENLPGWRTDRGETLIRYGLPINKIRYRPVLNYRQAQNYGMEKAYSAEEYSLAEVWYYTDMTLVFEDIYRNNHYRFNNPERRTTQLPNNTAEDAIEYRQAHFQQYVPEFEGPVFNVSFSTNQFKSLNKPATDIFLSFQIDPKDSTTLKEYFDNGYTTGIFFYDYAQNKRMSTRKTFPAFNQPGIILNSLMINLPPDSGLFAFEMTRNKDKGTASYHNNIKVNNFLGSSLKISDVVMASDVQTDKQLNGAIQRGNYSVLPNTSKSFSKNVPLFLYYEAYNLKKGQNNITDFEQKITIQRKEEDGILNDILDAVGIDSKGKKISLTTKNQTMESDPQIYLQLDMSKYNSGNYIITISVKDNLAGNEASSHTEIIWK